MKATVQKRVTAIVIAALLVISFCISACGAEVETGFSDVAANAWYAGAVEYVRDNGLMSGTTATTFSPDTTTSRAMLVTILYQRAGSPNLQATGSFYDVALDAWYADAIRWAAQNGIVSGYSDGRFGPNDPVTREQLASILWRSAGSPAAEQAAAFADEGSISPFAVQAVAWARGSGIISGKEGNRFDPNGSATRAETAVMLQRWGTRNMPTAPPSDSPAVTPPSSASPSALRIQVQDGARTVLFELNDSPAAQSLYSQLPLTIAVQDYSDNEKIFYPPQKLDTTDATPAEGPAGTLAYFSPWGDVVMYYSSCGPYDGLYELGQAVSGGDQIENLTGTLQITQVLE